MTTVAGVRATMDAYLAALVARQPYADFFTNDAELVLVSGGQTVRGRDAVASTIRVLHEQAFDGSPELVSLVVDGDRAALEAEFVGRHIGEFAGVAPPGRAFRVPYSVHYVLDGDRIAKLTIYGLAADLMAALTTDR